MERKLKNPGRRYWHSPMKPQAPCVRIHTRHIYIFHGCDWSSHHTTGTSDGGAPDSLPGRGALPSKRAKMNLARETEKEAPMPCKEAQSLPVVPKGRRALGCREVYHCSMGLGVNRRRRASTSDALCSIPASCGAKSLTMAKAEVKSSRGPKSHCTSAKRHWHLMRVPVLIPSSVAEGMVPAPDKVRLCSGCYVRETDKTLSKGAGQSSTKTAGEPSNEPGSVERRALQCGEGSTRFPVELLESATRVRRALLKSTGSENNVTRVSKVNAGNTPSVQHQGLRDVRRWARRGLDGGRTQSGGVKGVIAPEPGPAAEPDDPARDRTDGDDF
ncbi:hypothetical protein BJV78DRAFT_1356614 [Lactifluus subvellereus]|nr:hypothetical protein BJV78DRAFT_1356614 [Lactifluus subvellereus]